MSSALAHLGRSLRAGLLFALLAPEARADPPSGIATPDASGAPQGPCRLDEEAFRTTVARARTHLDAENLDAFVSAQQQLETLLPCLVVVPEPRLWAGHLVDVAVVAYFRGEDWQTPLATALAVAPDIDRGVGPKHEIAAWDPPPPPATEGAVPRGVELYVDGVRQTRVPGPGGLHLVQARDASGLRSLLLRDEPISRDWLRGERAQQKGPEPADPTAPPWTLGIALWSGYGRYAQEVDSPGDYVDNAQGSALGVGGLAQLWVGSPWGRARRTLTGNLQLQGSLRPSGHAALGWRGGPVFAGLGLALDTATWRAADGAHNVFVTAPVVSLQAWSAGPLPADLGLVASVWPGSTSVTLRGATTLGSPGPRGVRSRLRAGLAAGWRQQRLVQGEVRELRAADWQLGVQLGLAWGDW